MVNILFISYEEKKKEFLSHLLGPEYFIIVSDEDRKKIDSLVPAVELVIVDFSSLEWEGLNVITKVRQCDDSIVILGVGRQVKKETIQAARERGLAEYVDMDRDITFLSRLIKERVEKEMLISKIKEEKISREPLHHSLPPEKEKFFSLEEWQFLEEISRFLIHGYNLDELMQFFLSFLNRMFGITRLCLLLKDEIKNNYWVKACLGMAEEMKEYVQLYPQRGLAKFLAREGTVITRESIAQIDFKITHEIKQEMKLIHSNVVIPLSPQGELIGILGLGPKIIGEEISPREIKQIFLLSNQVGLAIQNLLFYEEMFYQKKYIENVLKNASSGVISVDVDQKITTYNPQAQKMLNLKSQNLVGKDIRKLPSPLGDLLFETLTRGTFYEREEVYVPAIKRWMGISTSQMRDAEGKVIGSMMIFTDLSLIKRLQEEKKKTQKRDFLGQVAVRLSQELRNSFVPIKSLAELLPSKYLDEEFQKKLFSVVTREVERIDNLIERLVFFTQPLHLYKTAESVSSLITETLEQVKRKIPKDKKIQSKVTCKEENLQVYVDKKAIVEAFTHIVDNSIEAIQNKSPKVEIHCGATDKLPEVFSIRTDKKIVPQEFLEYVKIEIKDNGPGLPEDKDKIFDPFFATKSRGIGVGLTISQSIIEEHGGAIVPFGERGKGTTMVVYLPRYQLPC